MHYQEYQRPQATNVLIPLSSGTHAPSYVAMKQELPITSKILKFSLIDWCIVLLNLSLSLSPPLSPSLSQWMQCIELTLSV